MLNCITCGREIPIGDACYQVKVGKETFFRHTGCPEPVSHQPLDYVVEPRFGEVVDDGKELD